jgi:hypothetical protein
MERNEEKQFPRPPRLVASLRAGFDAVATHISLILFPLALDLFLWFGPHWNLKALLQPLVTSLGSLPGFDTADTASLLKASQQIWQTFIADFNLAVVMRTFPVGIPSLMAGQLPTTTPLGTAPITHLSTAASAAFLWLIFVIIGLVAGGIYFGLVAKATFLDDSALTFAQAGWISLQVILLTVSWVVLLLVISVPIIFMLSLVALFSPGVAQIALILVSLFLLWILLPLLFSPHGIFLYRQNALLSMLTSARLVRFILPGTATFFLAILVISQGLDLLWQAPPPNSWLALVGIAGHAFITTGLLAASFVYYRDAMRFVQEFLQRAVASQSRTTT